MFSLGLTSELTEAIDLKGTGAMAENPAKIADNDPYPFLTNDLIMNDLKITAPAI